MITDLSLITNQIKNIDYVIVAGITDTEIPDVFNASVLLPPTELLMAWADNAPYVMQNQYPQYLRNCREADDMIVALLAALTKKNVVMYIPEDEFRIFGNELLNYIYFEYGITMNTPTTTFAFDESKLPMLLSKFYMIDILDAKDYLALYPGQYQLIMWPELINKLALEIRPFNRPASYDEYYAYFNNIVRLNMQGLIQPVTIVRKDDEK
jgi:hypothetical protein